MVTFLEANRRWREWWGACCNVARFLSGNGRPWVVHLLPLRCGTLRVERFEWGYGGSCEAPAQMPMQRTRHSSDWIGSNMFRPVGPPTTIRPPSKTRSHGTICDVVVVMWVVVQESTCVWVGKAYGAKRVSWTFLMTSGRGPKPLRNSDHLYMFTWPVPELSLDVECMWVRKKGTRRIWLSSVT